MRLESYHGSDPLKQARSIQNLDHLSDAQCIALIEEMETKDFNVVGFEGYEVPELAYQKARWLINRARQIGESA